jgi:cyclic pyranopterin monophosphate synthase
MPDFSHLDAKGHIQMIDVGNKPLQKRMARAQGSIFLATETINLIKAKLIKKGDVLTLAEIAAICAAKKTSELMPLCHHISLNKIAVNFKIEEQAIIATSEIHCVDRTGVEMEALTAVSIALLNIYDMCKAVDKNMRIGEIILLEKIKS